MGTYIHYTDEQKEQANSVDLEEFLRRRGRSCSALGGSPGWPGSIILLSGATNGTTILPGGAATRSASSSTFYGTSYQEAMELLLGKELGEAYPAAQPKREEPPKPFVLPPPHTDMRRVYAYLMKQRHISRG